VGRKPEILPTEGVLLAWALSGKIKKGFPLNPYRGVLS